MNSPDRRSNLQDLADDLETVFRPLQAAVNNHRTALQLLEKGVTAEQVPALMLGVVSPSSCAQVLLNLAGVMGGWCTQWVCNTDQVTAAISRLESNAHFKQFLASAETPRFKIPQVDFYLVQPCQRCVAQTHARTQTCLTQCSLQASTVQATPPSASRIHS